MLGRVRAVAARAVEIAGRPSTLRLRSVVALVVAVLVAFSTLHPVMRGLLLALVVWAWWRSSARELGLSK